MTDSFNDHAARAEWVCGNQSDINIFRVLYTRKMPKRQDIGRAELTA